MGGGNESRDLNANIPYIIACKYIKKYIRVRSGCFKYIFINWACMAVYACAVYKFDLTSDEDDSSFLAAFFFFKFSACCFAAMLLSFLLAAFAIINCANLL